MESILIFGGGLNQLTLIQSSKDLGYRTIVIDPIEDAPAKEIADMFEVVAPKDYEKTKEIALQYKVKGIVTCQMENPLLLMAQLAEELNFIFPSKESVLNARNKYLMKQCFLKNNVPCAKGILIKKDEEISEELCNGIGFPLIIKPVDSFSSRGVFKINSFSELENYLNNTRGFSSNGDILIEEFMEGPEVSVECVVQNGKTTIVQITDKIITPYPAAVEMGHIQPSELSSDIQEQIKTIVINAVKALGIDNCGGHAEVKVTKQGVKMVEMGARLGGDYITSHLVPLSTGVNIEAAIIKIAMGEYPDLTHKFNKASSISYLLLTTGKTIASIKAFDKTEISTNAKNVYLFIKEGQIVSDITDSAKRPACVILQNETRDSILKEGIIAIEKLKDKIILN
jgi:biotin carboxylase